MSSGQSVTTTKRYGASSVRRQQQVSRLGARGPELRKACAGALDEDEVLLLFGESDGLLEHRARLIVLARLAEHLW
jgi:hypothetical protein